MKILIKNFMDKDYEKILQLITTKRVEKGLTLSKMGEIIGLSESGYFKIEKGVSRLDLMRFIVILNHLDISPQDFFLELEETTPLHLINR